MRCAIYARYSSDLQRDTSIDDQLRKCREWIGTKQGWSVVEEYVLADRGISGASVTGREALQRLLLACKQRPLQFDVVLIDDTSRLSRNLADALRATEILNFNGVELISVSQGISSKHESSRSMFALHGIMDEQFLAGLASKVHRGQEGRVLSGYISGGRRYGYINTPIEDPTKIAKYGRKAVKAVCLTIDQGQAAVIRRIFEMCAHGFSLAAQGVLQPDDHHTARR